MGSLLHVSEFWFVVLLGEDAQDEGLDLKELFEKKKNIEVKDPKKSLRGFFEREGKFSGKKQIFWKVFVKSFLKQMLYFPC